ncbi:MAG TPA: RDD family protein, partial [Longimicrobiales bacterium]|nr:RDD family protein [Longimicrobiales bacterium]
DEGEGGPSEPVVAGGVEGGEGGGPGFAEGLEAAGAVIPGLFGKGPLAQAETPEEAEQAALRLMESLEVAEPTRQERLDILEEMTPPDAPWADQARRIYGRALDRWEEERSGAGRPGGGGEEPGSGVSGEAIPEAVAGEVAELSDHEVLEAYGALLRRGIEDSAGAPGPRARVLRRRAIGILAADTLRSLEREVADLQDAVGEEASRRRDAERKAEERGNAFVALLRDIWEQLGSAIGLWSIYFTVVTTLFAGQTVGKRLLGIRVLRLDGERINAWTSFERAGGYVAGLATGLLGFAQVFWDPNRQCVHDKIVGTVVIDDRAEKVPGAWEETWAASPEGAAPPAPSGDEGERQSEREREAER